MLDLLEILITAIVVLAALGTLAHHIYRRIRHAASPYHPGYTGRMQGNLIDLGATGTFFFWNNTLVTGIRFGRLGNCCTIANLADLHLEPGKPQHVLDFHGEILAHGDPAKAHAAVTYHLRVLHLTPPT